MKQKPNSVHTAASHKLRFQENTGIHRAKKLNFLKPEYPAEVFRDFLRRIHT